ncbi:DUF4184 domain-containing protein [Streptomyces spongiicola]|uniref:DUF4184 domain-containing protein n=1 Tax=Streptomyces spongiicola TaxID=1690221 RepID=A0A2S1YV77_9ACTN|nr:DUF4184 family protein [Streptomyces spongiicola]AWK07999.1 DUF4184 domain-containing protein [Streptomyces spongiicola]GBQ01241.1 DUF4184 domain-containing protein [Streptomyces spongiicola]
MPFTLSHAAAVLPCIRRDGTARGPLVASALVAGSFAPDATYFTAGVLPGAMRFGEVTHGPLGVLTVDVAVAAGLVGLWLMVREPLLALLPRRLQARAHAVARGGARHDRSRAALALWFCVSAAIGAATHVVWDAFTHLDRWGTRALPVLAESVAGIPLYTYTQYGSSILALVALGWFTRSAWQHAPGSAGPVPVPSVGRRGRWAAVVLLTLCVLASTVHRCVRFYHYRGGIDTPLDIVPTVCFGVGAGLAVGVVLYGAAVRVRSRRSTGPDTAPPPERAGVS